MHPYEQLDPKFFWSTAVAQRSMFDIDQLWDPKFPIRASDKVITFGSCFAQHIGRALRDRGYTWHIAEQAPPGLNSEHAQQFNYGLFSARTGNIYTVSQLKQWIEWSTGAAAMPDEVWTGGERFYDPFRPTIEPDGFASEGELRNARSLTLEAFRSGLLDADVLVFTLGLTESWIHTGRSYEYPLCPGTVRGSFDPEAHQFVNQEFPFIRKTLCEALQKAREVNPKLRVLLTVSPVPLTATMSGQHVLVATMESKSTLRAVAASVQRELPFVDYFPSYEIINATPFRGTFFEPNLRSVNPAGVAHVMSCFFGALQAKFGDQIARASMRNTAKARKAGAKSGAKASVRDRRRTKEDAVCEEELLNAFAR